MKIRREKRFMPSRVIILAAVLMTGSPGLDFDGARFVLSLAPEQADGGPRVTRFARNGVFGRWRYVAGVNAFITVSDAGGNVFFYKHTAGNGDRSDRNSKFLKPL